MNPFENGIVEISMSAGDDWSLLSSNLLFQSLETSLFLLMSILLSSFSLGEKNDQKPDDRNVSWGCEPGTPDEVHFGWKWRYRNDRMQKPSTTWWLLVSDQNAITPRRNTAKTIRRTSSNSRFRVSIFPRRCGPGKKSLRNLLKLVDHRIKFHIDFIDSDYRGRSNYSCTVFELR